MRNTGVQTVDRALLLLLAFDAEGQESASPSWRGPLGVHKSTASRLAATLAARGFLERPPGSDAFRLGPELAASACSRSAGVTSSSLGASRDGAARRRDRRDREPRGCRRATRWSTSRRSTDDTSSGSAAGRGAARALHCTANGKVLLAFAGDRDAGRTLRGVHRSDDRDRAQRFDATLAAVRRRGYATAVGELEDGLHAVAAPVLERDGGCRAALSVSGPSYRMPERAAAGARRRAAGSRRRDRRLLDGDARAA